MRKMKDGLISRQDAIEALRRAEALTRAFGYHNVIDTIRELPSAERSMTDMQTEILFSTSGYAPSADAYLRTKNRHTTSVQTAERRWTKGETMARLITLSDVKDVMDDLKYKVVGTISDRGDEYWVCEYFTDAMRDLEYLEEGVFRCFECGHAEKQEDGRYFCRKSGTCHPGDWFCGDGAVDVDEQASG